MGENYAMEYRILVVDDNTDLTSIVSMILRAEGFSVKVCNDLSELDAFILDWHPQLLLMDVNVNGEDGRIFCKKIKDSGEYGVIKTILMSGDESTLDHTDLVGVDDYLAKPFDSTILLEKIKNCSHQPPENT